VNIYQEILGVDRSTLRTRMGKLDIRKIGFSTALMDGRPKSSIGTVPMMAGILETFPKGLTSKDIHKRTPKNGCI
jgi:hypothetical protein